MSLPLEGCRVLDLGIITAGAATGAMLADLGAEVIKVESPSYRDPFRAWTGKGGSYSPFRFTNRNKEGISIDLKSDAGRDVFFDLVRKSDFVVENFRRGVLTDLGIDYPVLAEINPGIILASISSQGEAGPLARYVSFGTTLEAMAGLAWHTGYDEASGPVATGRALNYPDQVVALFATGLMLTAWRERQRTGNGAHLDLSQRELTSFLVGELFAQDAEATPRTGNADADYLYQQSLCTRDGWIAVSVAPGQGDAAAQVAGLASFSADGFARWCNRRDSDDALAQLRLAGIAASQVMDGQGVLADRGVRWQDAMATFDGDVLVKGLPFRYESAPLRIRHDAPGTGEDTGAVLQRVTGYSADRIAALMAAGAVEGPAG
jgi:formyl-CoA transferase